MWPWCQRRVSTLPHAAGSYWLQPRSLSLSHNHTLHSINSSKRRVVYPRLTQDLLMNMDGFNALPNPLDFKVTNQPTASLPSPTHAPRASHAHL